MYTASRYTQWSTFRARGKFPVTFRNQLITLLEHIRCQIAQLPDGSQPKYILVEGAPGVGKSTLAWKLCRKWGKGKLLQQYQLVVLLKLRDKYVQAAKSIANLFKYHRLDIQQAVVEEVQDKGGKGILLLFEGYDELPEELRTEASVFLDVITGRELPEATILITSRPWASEHLHWECKGEISQHIEILGFTKANIHSYLESTTADNPSLLASLRNYISCYPHISSLMYIPLNSAIVVEVYRNSKEDDTLVPKTMTELYSSLVRSLLLRHLLDHPVHSQKRRWRVCSFSDLPPDVYQQLCELGKLGYEGILNRQQVIFYDLPVDFETLGLMQCAPELYADEGAVVSYCFLHLTLQEYLGAFHLSQQPVEKQIQHFRRFCADNEDDRLTNSHFSMVLKFLSGLQKFSGYPSEVLMTLFVESDGNSSFKFDGESDSTYDVDSGGDSESGEECNAVEGCNGESGDDSNAVESGGSSKGESGDDSNTVESGDDSNTVESGDDSNTIESGDDSNTVESGDDSNTVESGDDSNAVESGDDSNIVESGGSCTDESDYTNDAHHGSCIGEWGDNSSSFGSMVTFDTLHWLFEARDNDLIANLLGSSDIQPNQPTAMTAFDCYVLGYCVSHSNCTWRISLYNFIGDEGIEMFVRGALEEDIHCTGGISEIDLSGNGITSEAVKCLMNIPLRLASNMETLDLRSNSKGGGYIPDNYSISIQWYFGAIKRMDAERKLLKTGNPSGTFLIRESESQPGNYSLSIRDGKRVRHYCIRKVSTDCYYITPHCMFKSLEELVEHYSGNADGLCCQLTVVCPNFNSTLGSLTALAYLKSLRLSFINIGQRDAVPLVISLTALKSLEELSLHRTGIGMEDCRTLGILLSSSTSLNNLTIHEYDLPPEAVKHIITGLHHSTTLTRLDMTNSCFSLQNTISLASVLKANHTLVSLFLQCCNIYPDGACQLASALCMNDTLQELWLCFNPIGVEGATAFAKMLLENKSLKRLNLDGTSIGVEGTRKLICSLVQNTTVETLWLPANNESVTARNILDNRIKHVFRD